MRIGKTLAVISAAPLDVPLNSRFDRLEVPVEDDVVQADPVECSPGELAPLEVVP